MFSDFGQPQCQFHPLVSYSQIGVQDPLVGPTSCVAAFSSLFVDLGVFVAGAVSDTRVVDLREMIEKSPSLGHDYDPARLVASVQVCEDFVGHFLYLF